MTIAPRSVCRWGKENDPAHRFVSRTSENPFRALFEEFFVSIKFTNSVASIVLLLVSATFAHAQNVLLFTFDDSGPNATSTVTGSYDTSGLTPGSFFLDEQTPPIPLGGPGPFGTAVVFSFGATTATSIDRFSNATAPGQPFLVSFSAQIETPLSEYLEIVATIGGPQASIGLAEGETVFNADTLANNVIVYQEGAFGGNLRNSFLTSTPTTVFSDPNGDNIIQFVLTPKIILGDVNGDLIVNFLDIAPFIQALATADFVEAADVNQDSELNFLDIAPFIQILSAG